MTSKKHILLVVCCGACFFLSPLVFLRHVHARSFFDVRSANSNNHEPGSVVRESAYAKTTVKAIKPNGDVVKEFESSVSPIHYKHNIADASEPWKDIDLTIAHAKTQDPASYPYSNTTNFFQSYFRQFSTESDTVKYLLGSSSIAYTLRDNELGKLQHTTGTAQGSSFVYRQAYDGVDVQFHLGPERLLEEFVVQRYQPIEQISQILSVERAVPQRVGRTYVFFDPVTHKQLWSIAEPVLYELHAPDTKDYGVEYRLICLESIATPLTPCRTYQLTKVLTEEGKRWLTDPARQYPVVIDASVDAQVGASSDDGDTDQGADTQNSITRTTMPIGSYLGNPHMGATRFTSITINQGTTIDSATFYATSHDAYDCGACTLSVRVSMENADNAAALTTTNMNDKSLTTANATWDLHNLAADTEYSVTITSAVQEVLNRGGWASGNSMVALVRDNSSTVNEYQQFWTYDGNTSFAPRLNITYTAATLEQEGFRFRNDDGSETAATWAASQDTNVSRATNLNTRLRVLVNASDDPDAAQYQLEYKKSSDSTYKKVEYPSATPTTDTFTANGTWRAPYGVSSATVKAWGAGGAGGGKTANGGGGGGGGGAYVSSSVSVTAGTDYAVAVGATTATGTGNGANGNPTTFNTTTVVAAGGTGGGGGTGSADTGGAGGTAAASTGDTEVPGGAGGNTSTATDGGAGGGEAGGTGGTGDSGDNGTSTGVGGAGGSGVNSDGGDGATGSSNSGANAAAGTAPGGGGGGAYRNGTNRSGGAGARGELSVTYTGEYIGYTNSGAVAAGTTSLSVAYPTGISSGDLLVLCVGNKYPNNGPSTPSGWTAPSNNQGSGGQGSNGVDTGSVYSTVYYKEADGTESGNLSVTITSGNVGLGRMFLYRKSAGKAWSVAATNGSDNTGNETAWSVTGAANPGITAGDVMFVCSAANTDAYTYSSESISATSVTFAGAVERQDSGTTTGQDMSLVVSDHVALSGTASAAPVFTMTSSGSTTSVPAGASTLFRIRQVDAPIQLVASSNISSSGENTTAQLTAPSGKSTSDFVTGRMQDDENPADSINITSNDYTELEWSIKATDTAAESEVYQFRVTRSGTVLNTYTVTPQWTISNTVVSVTLTTDGTVAYGTLGFGDTKNTITLSDTQTAQNDGNVTETFNIKTTAATGGTGWSLGSAPGSDTFVHEFSTNSGSNWTKFTTAGVYQTLSTGITASGTKAFDLQITAPNPSSDTVQKTITITVQAVAE
jgi:hypothetical protein